MIGGGISFSTLNWAYPTIPQKNLNGRTVKVNAGKALGGSTVINSMVFVGDLRHYFNVKLNRLGSQELRRRNTTFGQS